MQIAAEDVAVQEARIATATAGAKCSKGTSRTMRVRDGWGLRCRWDFSNLSAVRFVYRYVM
jgi:hypothetical protein